MGEGSDVVIRYSFLPTESSIREGAERAIKEVNRVGGRPLSNAAGRKLSNEADKTVNQIINFLRATQLKTSLQTKILSGLKFFEPFQEKINSVMEKLKLKKEFTPSINAVGVGSGEGGATPIQAGGGGGGVMGTLGMIAGLLLVISIVMTLIGAFFDAVGPFIKVVMKMLSAIILILLMPFLKRIMPFLGAFFTALINSSKEVSKGIDDLFKGLEGGDMSGILSLLLMGLLGPFFSLLLLGLQGVFGKIDITGMFTSVDDTIKKMAAGMQKGFKEGIEDPLGAFGTTLFNSDTDLSTKMGSLLGNFAAMELWFIEGGPIAKLKLLLELANTDMGKAFTDLLLTLTNSNTDLETKMNDLSTWIKNSLAYVLTSLGDIIVRGYNKIAALVGILNQLKLEAIKWTVKTVQNALPVHKDFISRPGGGIQAFSPSDTIIGMKNPSAMGGGISITNNITISPGADKTEMKKLFSDFAREQARELRMRTSYVSGVYA